MVLVAVAIVSMGFINQLITGGPTLYELSYTNQSGPKQFQVFFSEKQMFVGVLCPPCFHHVSTQNPVLHSFLWLLRTRGAIDFTKRVTRNGRNGQNGQRFIAITGGDRRWHWHWRSVQRIQRAPRRKDILNLDQ